MRTAVDETVELTFSWPFSDVSTQSGSCEIEGIDEDKTEGPSNTTRKERHGEVFSFFGMATHVFEENFVKIVLGGEVDGLGGEVSDHIGPVASPEGDNSFLFDATHEAVHDTLINVSVPVYGLWASLGLFI